MESWPGSAYPLGATFDGSGTNFALFSEVAERVELCLFDVDAQVEAVEPASRSPRSTPACGTPTCRACSPASATATGSTVLGPDAGPAVNPAKLLLDPYARRPPARSTGTGAVRYDFGAPDSRNDDDSGPHMTYGVVIDPLFDWEDDRRPPSPTTDRHLRGARQGLTILHPDVPEELRGRTPRSPIRR